MEKLTNLEHLRRSAAKSKELIGEVAQAAADAIGELAGEMQGRIPVKEVTQAEYDALSEEEKQAAMMYVLLDGEGSGGESETPDAGVLSFNGRRGDIVPHAGDYTADMVGADPVGAAQAALKELMEAWKGLIPSGVVLIWTGAADAVPEGWALCDGSNGTPDLRGRFVVGVDRAVTAYWFSSNNQKKASTTASVVFTAKKAVSGIKLTYRVQSEASYDKLSFWRGSTQVGSDLSGSSVSGTLAFGDLASGATMKFRYLKDGSNDTGSDTAEVSVSFTADGKVVELGEENLAEYFDLSYPDSYKFTAAVKTTPASYPAGATGGEAAHKLTTAEMPSHSHTQYAPYISSNVGSQQAMSYPTSATASGSSVTRYQVSASKISNALPYNNVATGGAGSGSAHNNLPPYYAMCYIMKL